MNQIEKQKIEDSKVFKKFVRLQKNILPAIYISVQGESPDFIIDCSGHKVGLEVTGLYISQDKQELESIKSYILNKTKEICFEYKDELNISVKIIYSSFIGPSSPHYRVSKLTLKNKKNISNKLASQIIENAINLEDGNRTEFKPKEIPEIFKVFIHRTSIKITKAHLWCFTKADTVRRSAVDDLRKSINDKERKYLDYIKKCDECWLLIAADRYNPSQRFDLSEETLCYLYESKFNRIFYIESALGQLEELNIKQM